MKLGFLSDIHEDVESLKKAIIILEKSGCNELICLGDICGFSVDTHKYLESRNANECISIIRSNCSIVIPGNHDLFSVRRIPEFTKGFDYDPNWYNLAYNEREEIANQQIWLYERHDLSPLLTRKNKVYLESLEEFQIVEFDGIQILFSHYAFPDLSGSTTEFISKQDQLKKHFNFQEIHQCSMSFSGHRHIEGCTIASHDSIIKKGFEKINIQNNDALWIDGPAVCRSKKQNGVMIFDTKYRQLHCEIIR